MSLDRHLKKWVDAGLIDSDQAEAITTFERERSGPSFLYAIAGLGGLAITIGLVSIVAANWAAIPGSVKIGVDLALVAVLGQLVVAWDARGRLLAREIGVLVLYGGVLASIALVGQVYQLGGEARVALGAWTILTALLMTRAQSAIAAFVWVLGLEITWAFWVAEYADDQSVLGTLVVATFYWIALGLLWLGRGRWLRERRPAFARVFHDLGWVQLVTMASIGSLAFYEDTRSYATWTGLWIGLAISAALTAFIARGMSATAPDRAQRNLLFACVLLAHVPILLSPGGLGVVSALCFVGLWFLVAVAAHRGGAADLLSLATAVIGLRLLGVDFEVFGSLLGTGFGLVSGGLLTLGALWLWNRKRREFAAELSEADRP